MRRRAAPNHANGARGRRRAGTPQPGCGPGTRVGSLGASATFFGRIAGDRRARKAYPAPIDIQADDIERARRFYERVFGWRFESWGPPDFYLIHTGTGAEPGAGGATPPSDDEVADAEIVDEGEGEGEERSA